MINYSYMLTKYPILPSLHHDLPWRRTIVSVIAILPFTYIWYEISRVLFLLLAEGTQTTTHEVLLAVCASILLHEALLTVPILVTRALTRGRLGALWFTAHAPGGIAFLWLLMRYVFAIL
jgi:hypothetical protein